MVFETYDDVSSDLFNDSLEFRESTRYTREKRIVTASFDTDIRERVKREWSWATYTSVIDRMTGRRDAS